MHWSSTIQSRLPNITSTFAIRIHDSLNCILSFLYTFVLISSSGTEWCIHSEKLLCTTVIPRTFLHHTNFHTHKPSLGYPRNSSYSVTFVLIHHVKSFGAKRANIWLFSHLFDFFSAFYASRDKQITNLPRLCSSHNSSYFTPHYITHSHSIFRHWTAHILWLDASQFVPLTHFTPHECMEAQSTASFTFTTHIHSNRSSSIASLS